jgi:hypothetical protein
MAHMVKNESYNMYTNITMNMDVLNTLLENDLLESIMRSIFQFINIELVNVEHCTNITYLHQQKKTMILNIIKTRVIETYNIKIIKHE